jgi:hypothetical protein
MFSPFYEIQSALFDAVHDLKFDLRRKYIISQRYIRTMEQVPYIILMKEQCNLWESRKKEKTYL